MPFSLFLSPSRSLCMQHVVLARLWKLWRLKPSNRMTRKMSLVRHATQTSPWMNGRLCFYSFIVFLLPWSEVFSCKKKKKACLHENFYCRYKPHPGFYYPLSYLHEKRVILLHTSVHDLNLFHIFANMTNFVLITASLSLTWSALICFLKVPFIDLTDRIFIWIWSFFLFLIWSR